MTEERTNMYQVSISGDPKFFAMIPKMAGQDLSPGAYKLYGLFKDIAGEAGACWTGQTRLLELLGEYKGHSVSINTLRDWRDELVQSGYTSTPLRSRTLALAGFSTASL